MNRNIIQVVLSNTKNKKLFQITHLKKISIEYDYLLSKIITFKKYYQFSDKVDYYTTEYLIWINKFIFFEFVFYTEHPLWNRSYSRYITLFEYLLHIGNLDIIKWYYKNKKDLLTRNLINSKYFSSILSKNNVLLEVFLSNNINVINFVYENIKDIPLSLDNIDIPLYTNMISNNNFIDFYINYCVENDSDKIKINFDVLNFLNKNGFCCTTYAMDRAARYGHLDIVIWLHENRRGLNEGCTTDAMDLAAYSGRLDIVRWLHENRSEGCTTFAMDHAARYGHLDVVKFLHENRNEGCTTEAILDATQLQHLDIVKFLYKNYTNLIYQKEIYDKILLKGIRSNNVDLCKFIVENFTYKKISENDFNMFMIKKTKIDFFNYMMSIKSKIIDEKIE